MSADTGLGKTNLGLALAGHAATGTSFLHWQAHRAARILYIDGEMSRQLFKRRIEDVVRRLALEGVTTYVEVGPGAVLSGLVRKIVRDATVVNFGSPDDLASVDSLIHV